MNPIIDKSSMELELSDVKCTIGYLNSFRIGGLNTHMSMLW